MRLIHKAILAAVFVSSLGGCSLLTPKAEVSKPQSPTAIATPVAGSTIPTTVETSAPLTSEIKGCADKVKTVIAPSPETAFTAQFRDDCPEILASSLKMKSPEPLGSGPVVVYINTTSAEDTWIAVKVDRIEGLRFDNYVDEAIKTSGRNPETKSRFYINFTIDGNLTEEGKLNTVDYNY
jgi:hypothetical protein